MMSLGVHRSYGILGSAAATLLPYSMWGRNAVEPTQ